MSATLFSETHSSNLKVFVEKRAIPQFRELLTQGVIAGSFALFIHAVIYSFFFIDNYYKQFIVGALHEFLGIGALTGLVHGVIYWCYARLFHARFQGIARLLTSLITVAIGYCVLEFFQPSPYFHVPVLASWFGAQVISLAVMTGSKWRPWRALVYGVGRINTGQRLPGSAIGLLLRLVMLFGCFEAIFLFVCVLQMNEQVKDFVTWWLIVLDFLIGLIVVLTIPRFWVALTLAVVINAPWLFILIKYFNELRFIRFFFFGYLVLWGAYLLTQCRRLDPLFSSIREELRYYYLVD